MDQQVKERALKRLFDSPSFKVEAGDVFRTKDGYELIFITPTYYVRHKIWDSTVSDGGAVNDQPDGTYVAQYIKNSWSAVFVDVGRRFLDGGFRKDTGRRHFIVEIEPRVFRYGAGCRSFRSLTQALDHWDEDHPGPMRLTKRAMAIKLFSRAVRAGFMTAARAGLPIALLRKKRRKR